MTIQIDADFIRCGGKTYAINKINSLEVREVSGGGALLGWILLIPAGVFGFIGFGAMLGHDSGLGAICIFAASALGTFAAIRFSKASERMFQLYLMTSSAGSQAFSSRDRAEIEALRDRIEGAMLSANRARVAA